MTPHQAWRRQLPLAGPTTDQMNRALASKANASTVGGMATALNAKAPQSAVDALASAMPQPAATMPPAVSDASAKGSMARYAREDHTHASSVQSRRVALTLVGGKAAWIYPISFAPGVVPVIELSAETPEGAAYKNDASLVEGSVTNTQCVIAVQRVYKSQTLPGVLSALLNMVITIFAPAVGAVHVHCWARLPTS